MIDSKLFVSSAGAALVGLVLAGCMPDAGGTGQTSGRGGAGGMSATGSGGAGGMSATGNGGAGGMSTTGTGGAGRGGSGGSGGAGPTLGNSVTVRLVPRIA